ncbi:MAG: SufD family Fe-S cluster assembly protein [Candidatus Uhrbacteria bacterium]|nr:SufD family Fe-S cluster assembly protein [Candidatus Uhrbacteria bacterium]
MKTLKTTHIPAQARTLEKRESMTMVTFLKKGWKGKKVFTMNLDKEGSSFEWFIFVFGYHKEKFHLDLEINHCAPRTKSRVYTRCVLTDQSEVRFTGVGSVSPQAQKSDTYLSFHALLLSKEAHAHVVPSLEIRAQDISAGHAASVDRFLPNDLFYLETRGLAERDAQAFLTQGFLSADAKHLLGQTDRASVLKNIETRISTFL